MARREERKPLALEASCRTLHRHKNVSLWDLSSHGCRIFMPGMDLSEGTRVVIKTQGFEGLCGMVRWAGQEFAGIAFDTPLHPAVVDHLCRLNPDDSRVELAVAA